MATIATPAGNSTLPTASTEMVAEPITGWFNAIRTFCNEAGNLDEANADLTSADGLVGKSTVQTIAGQKTFTKATFTEVTTIGYFSTMQLNPLYVTAGEAIAAGDLVYVSAWDATNSRFTVSKAIATTSTATTFYARYVAPSAISSGAAGVVCQVAVLSSQDTSGLTAGRPVYLSVTGGLWQGALPAVSSMVQIVGEVVTVHASTGRVAITLPGSMIPWSIADQV